MSLKWETSCCSWDCRLGVPDMQNGSHGGGIPCSSPGWVQAAPRPDNQHSPAASQNSPKMGRFHTWELASSFSLIDFMDMKSSIANYTAPFLPNMLKSAS